MKTPVDHFSRGFSPTTCIYNIWSTQSASEIVAAINQVKNKQRVGTYIMTNDNL